MVKVTHPAVSVRYQNRVVESLYLHTVALRNTGNRALKNQKVMIKLPGGGEIVQRELQTPRGADFPTDLETSQLLSVTLDLLNPRERLVVTVTVIDSPTDALEVIARGENLVFKEI